MSIFSFGPQRRAEPKHTLAGDLTASEAAMRRFCHIHDIRSADGGYKLSFEVLSLLVLILEEDWIFGPNQAEIDARSPK